NAVKFTPRGGTVTLHIERTSTSSEHADIRFEIIDTGAGMSEEFIPHAFEPFEQENNGEKGGTGLGLAICKNLVETMGGTIKVESKKGVGTKFTITLSFPYSHEMPKAKHVAVAVPQANFDGLHILMAEDHPLNTEIVQKLLEKRGFIVDTAENGKIAVDKFAKSEKNYYCAILMDVRMPEMDGLTATKKIRGLERADGKTIPIIAISANAFDEDIGKAKASGMTSYLAKPINSTQMFEVLAEYMYK
ncbi:MAG: ATP-binding protein, partial [Oscillospiraceae bacterium]